MNNKFILLGLLSLFSLNFLAQEETNHFWLNVGENEVLKTGERQIVPQKYLTYRLNGQNLKSMLFSAPHERTTRLENSPCIVYLPAPNGNLQRFKLIESPIMEEALSASYPQIRTFAVRGIDDPYASGRLDWNLYGFHGMVMSPSGDYFIDPYCLGNLDDYITYYTADFRKEPKHVYPEAEPMDSDTHKKPVGGSLQTGSNTRGKASTAGCVGGMLRTYRLAVACTGEYAQAATGVGGSNFPTMAQTLSKINTSVNRVDGVYETELAVRLVLVAKDTLVIFTNPSTDPFNGNSSPGILIGESQTIITNTIGSANFDIGHTFSTGGGGLANLGVVCSNSNKARGITGNTHPVGDPYDIDYVAHEMGHQFNGQHTFNAGSGSCGGGNRFAGSAVEPGSGVTIMAYAGICPGNNIQNNSIPYFHAISYDEIVLYTQVGSGNSCPVKTSTGNNPPVVTVSNYLVPVSTPFYMSGSATDPDGDKLSYSWEETDTGDSTRSWNSGKAPFFRSYSPDTPQVYGTNIYTRYFPKPSVAASGNFTNVLGEFLPENPQTLNFRLTARDKRIGGGGVCSSDNIVTVDASGPFAVSYPSNTGIVWYTSTQQNVLWDVNGTNTAPVSCDSVRISISYNSGSTYSVIVNSTANDGVEAISVPTLSATIMTCKIKVESIGNVFYDISNNNFAISTATDVGVKEVSADNPNAFIAWPNPFNGQLNFAADNLDSRNNTNVMVIDMLGRTVLEKNYYGRSELKETLDLSGINAGVYFISLSNNGNKVVHRLVKQ